MKFKLHVPSTLVLLFSMMILALIATHLLPQGEFSVETTEAGRQVVVAGSYHEITEKVSLTPWDLFLSVPKAFSKAQDIIFFVFIIGGVLSIIRATGVVDAVLGKTLKRFGDQPNMLIVAGVLLFSIASSSLGMAEEYIPFVSILLAMCIALKLDAITAIGIMVVGYGIGYGLAAINPFTLIIAQSIAGLEPSSGIAYRLFLFPFMLAIGLHHIIRYAKKVRRSPEQSLVANLNLSGAQSEHQYPPLTAIHRVMLILIVATIALIVYGISPASGWHWYLTELGATFLILGLVIAGLGRISPDKAAKYFSVGAAELTTTALLIGFARAIAVILEDGKALHTVVNSIATPLQHTGPEIAAVGMFFVQSVFNFLIPSGSGQAYVTMPLMVPIADLVGLSRQTAVLAFQFGDGFTNMLVPTNVVLMSIIGIAGIPYDRWFKFIFPLMIKLWIAGSFALVIAVWIGYQ